METAKSLKRLFIGGLHHSVSESEIKEIFSSFGVVTTVDIVLRKDNKGNPVKAFGYANVNISETELKRCMSVLNKSKWKGGKLQIELAKECFLHRLAQERQIAAENKHKPHVDSIAMVMESLKKAGVENFKIKSAVPGTEVPEHKDWIVSKFGRVLPILHLQQDNKKKIIKYDPSKYCHNIKKLDHVSDSGIKMPVTKLTWHLDEQDDETSKKKRGIFPTPTQTAKRKKLSPNKNCVESSTTSDYNVQKNKILTNSVKHNASKYEFIEMTGNKFGVPALASYAGFKRQNLDKEETTAAVQRNDRSKAHLACYDSDAEELELITDEQKCKTKGLSGTDVKEQDILLEVVGEDYLLKHQTHWALKNSMRQTSKDNYNDTSNSSGSEYDSADTDEIISKIIPHKKLPEIKCDRKPDVVNSNTEVNTAKVDCESSGNEDTVAENSESSVDADYEEMTRNCYRIELSITDLEQLVNKSSKLEKTSQLEKSEIDLPKIDSGIPPSQGSLSLEQTTIPANIFLDVQNEDNSDNEMTSNEQLSNLLPCKGTQCFSEVKKTNMKGGKIISNPSLLNVRDEIYKESVDKKEKVNGTRGVILDSKSNCKPPPFKGRRFLQINSSTASFSVKQGLPTSEEKSKSEMHKMSEESKEDVKVEKETTQHIEPTSSQKIELSSSSVTKSDNERNKIESKAGNDGNVPECLLIKNKSSISPRNENPAYGLAAESPQNLEKRLLDNQKRLAALQKRQEETAVQKKLIQGALSDLTSQKSGKGKHVVFDSEEELESVEDIYRAADVNPSAESQDKKLVAKDFKTRTVGNLFDSEDEEEEDDNDDHDERFKIKPQFEGKAGQKLLALQSRFGTDERFRMDERFLESDEENMEESAEVTVGSQNAEEDEFVAEKRRALNILKSVVQDGIEKIEDKKERVKLKYFKDVSALHYDPTRKDHTVYETKLEESNKESKAERKKRKIEEEKLPEVSKEIYYDVNKDLKGMFTSNTKENEVTLAKEDEIQLENQCSEPREMPTIQQAFDYPSSNDAAKEDSSNFTFSFFEAATQDGNQKSEHYVTGQVPMSAFPWHEDPRFQDSSSEDEDDIENCEDITAENLVAFPEKKTNLFFFFKDDQRLIDGPKMFCRTTHLEDERDAWEENRDLLIEEYRKKHKDARRKIKNKQ